MAKDIDPRTAWESYQPSEKEPWDLKKVGHLYRRTTFGATWRDLQTAVAAGPDKTIDRLLAGGEGQESFDKQTEPLAKSLARANDGAGARSWWLYRMLYTPHPLREKMTLFWHNHFATSNAKVQNAGFMIRQYELMRKYALTSFRSMVTEMAGDPAMLVWLDGKDSKKGNPNENYARELMELFSLGIGNYTEKDIREAARAFTGWEIVAGQPTFNPKEHDDGQKTFLGKTGKFNADDITKICLEQKSALYFICGKLFRFLVSETIEPTHELLEPLAAAYKKSDFDTGAVVRTILKSNLFFSKDAYRSRIKSPVDFALGIAKGLEGRIGTTALGVALEGLGQNVFFPPSVKGWDGGQTWLNGQTLLFRQNLALALTSTEDARFLDRTDPAKLTRQHGKKTDEECVEFFLALFLQNDVPAASKQKLLDYVKKAQKQTVPVYWSKEDAADSRIRSLCHLVLTMPEFQLD